MRNLVVVLVVAFAVFGCGKQEDFTYQYKVNGCDTGEKTADSLEQYCQLLNNDEVNQGCARQLRVQEYNNRNCASQK